MILQYYRLRANSLPPTRANPSDAGLDLVYNPADDAQQSITINSGESVLLQTGYRFAIPHGYMMEIKNRSSMAAKRQLLVGACVVDSGYDGEVFINLHNVGPSAQTIQRGDRIAQAVVIPIVPVRWVESAERDIYGWSPITISQRGAGALGSTGK